MDELGHVLAGIIKGVLVVLFLVYLVSILILVF